MIFTMMPPAPQSLHDQIAPGCLKGCGRNCGCKKLDLRCFIFCKECTGVNCENPYEKEVSEKDVV